MPELFHDNEFWILVGFLIFVGLLFRPAVKMLTGGLDSRATRVRSELDEASRLRAEAQALLHSYRAKQEQAVKTAAEIIEAAKDEAEIMRQEGEAELKRSLAGREAQAMDRIAQAEQAAVDAVRARAAELAIRATTLLMPEMLDADHARSLVDKAIDDLPRSGPAV